MTCLKQAYEHLLETMIEQQEQLGALAPAVAHFLKVTASYWEGLFQCYQVADLPRTNNGTGFRARGRSRGKPVFSRLCRRPAAH